MQLTRPDAGNCAGGTQCGARRLEKLPVGQCHAGAWHAHLTLIDFLILMDCSRGIYAAAGRVRKRDPEKSGVSAKLTVDIVEGRWMGAGTRHSGHSAPPKSAGNPWPLPKRTYRIRSDSAVVQVRADPASAGAIHQSAFNALCALESGKPQ